MIDFRLATAVLFSPGYRYGVVVIALGMLFASLARGMAVYLVQWLVASTTFALIFLSAFMRLYPRSVAAREAAYMSRLASVYHPGIEVSFHHEPSTLAGFDFVTTDHGGRRSRPRSESRIGPIVTSDG